MGAVEMEDVCNEFVYAVFECYWYEKYSDKRDSERLLHVFSDLYSAQMYFEFWKDNNDEKPTEVTFEWLHALWDNEWLSPKELNEQVEDSDCYITYVIRKLPLFTYKKEV